MPPSLNREGMGESLEGMGEGLGLLFLSSTTTFRI